jgi:parvulin-like peptidyl-prolyl isomerase
MNIGFGVVVVVAIGILAFAAIATWYEDHFGFVASVNGETITRDDWNNRLLIEDFRLDVAESRAQTERAAGRWTEAQVQGRLEQIASQRSQLTTAVVEQLVDATLQEQLATQEGVAVTDAMIDARLVEEATSPAQRHVWAIEVAPSGDDPTAIPTEADIAAAESRAEEIVAELEDGADFEEIAIDESAGSTAAQGGDLGWIEAGDATLEPAFVEAVFDTELNGLTGVVQGADGRFRIGRATEEIAESVDPAYEQRIENAGLSLETYREALRVDARRGALEDHVIAGYLEPSAQRRTEEIFVSNPEPAPPVNAVKVRHILYSPNGDPSSASTLPPDDPAWADAEEAAQDAYERLVDDIDEFDAIARAETSDLSTQPVGGKLPFLDPTSGVDEAFANAIFSDAIADGELLEPVQSAFGWHVIQEMYRPPAAEKMDELRTEIAGGADFADLARDFSETETAADGGDLGWVVRGVLDDRITDAIFGAPISEPSDILAIEGDGLYLFRVLEEAVRDLDDEQRSTIEQSAFPRWYVPKKEAGEIERNETYLGQFG